MKWEITDHICSDCLGRVLERTTDSGDKVARCADCGREKPGDYRELCLCGLMLKTDKAAGFYCGRNENHEVGRTQEIVGLFDAEICGQ